MPTHRERLETCLSDHILDRTPVALWRHFPVDDQTPEGLARAILAFQRTFDFDLVKVTPASSFCLKDWGSQDEWHGDTEGTCRYTHRVIHHGRVCCDARKPRCEACPLTRDCPWPRSRRRR